MPLHGQGHTYLSHVTAAQFAYVIVDAMHAPMCTIGPSGPIARPDGTARAAPMTLANRVLNLSRLGIWVPLR